MARRLFDVIVALAALIVITPMLLVAVVGIRLTSPGPVFYLPRRTGYRGREFTLYKLRTMRVESSGRGRPITARHDARVFPFGAWLRAWKVDELPQLLNVLKGDMALVGPRPEDPDIVRKYYTVTDLETLNVLPGLSSPGSLYYYMHGEDTLTNGDVVESYVERLLPLKLALDREYVREASLLYDLRIVLRTIQAIAALALGRPRRADSPEMKKVRLMQASRR